MRTKMLSQIVFLIPFLLFSFVFSSSQEKTELNMDLNGELDKKLNELFGYYKNLIKNTQADEEVMMNTFKEKADDLIKETAEQNSDIYNTKPNRKLHNKLNDSLTIESTSFIQNSQKVKSPNTDFSYQPFVWTEFTVNKVGPSSRRGHSAVVVDTYVVIFGGCYMESKCFNDLFFMDLKTQNWILIPTGGEKPSPRMGHSAVLHGSVMWVYGGSSSDGYLNDLYSYNLETREWKKHFFTGLLTTGRAGHGAVLTNMAKMVVFGGYTDKGYSNDIFMINLVEERFETPLAVGKPPSPRESFSMVIINNRIFIFGGFQEGGVLNDLYTIDLMIWTWTPVMTQGPTPPPRQGMGSSRVGKKIYFVGGCDFRKQICYTDTFILDTETLWWTQIENSKTDISGRGDFTLSFFRGSLYTFGGCEMYKQCFNNAFIMNVNDLCPSKCSNNGDCKDLIGCVCKQGFISHDCSERVKCKDDCRDNGMCHNNGKCGCYPGWSGVVCNTLVACPKNCTSVDNGICQPDAACKCKPGFQGADCSGFIGHRTDSDNDDPIKALTAVVSEQIMNRTESKSVTEDETVIEPESVTEDNTVIEPESVTEDNTVIEPVNTKVAMRLAPNQTVAVAAPNATVAVPNDTVAVPNATQDEVEEDAIYTLGVNNATYIKTKDCSSNCTDRGLCLNSTCFCEQGFTTSDCSLTYKEYLEQGFKFSEIIKYMIASSVTGFIVALVYFMLQPTKISGDNFI